MANIVLIGMPGCGKSTVGVLLAKVLGLAFIDTDVVLQAQEERKLQDMINEIGVDAFLDKEERAVLTLQCDKTVIATGGSVVYGHDAMSHLHKNGLVIYIRLAYDEIERRLSNLATRGVTLREGQSLFDLYQERVPLYEKHADLVFDANEYDIENSVQRIVSLIKAYGEGKHGC